MPDKEPQAPINNQDLAAKIRNAAQAAVVGVSEQSSVPEPMPTTDTAISTPSTPNVDPVSHPFGEIGLHDALTNPDIPLTGASPDYPPAGLLSKRVPDPVKLDTSKRANLSSREQGVPDAGSPDKANDGPRYTLRRKLIGGSLAVLTITGAGVGVAAAEGAFGSGRTRVTTANTSQQPLPRVTESNGVDTILPSGQSKSTPHSTPDSKVPPKILAEQPDGTPSLEGMDTMALSSFEALPLQARLWYAAAKMQEANDLGPVTANINDPAEQLINGPYKEALGFAYGQVDKTTGAKLLAGAYFSSSSEAYQADKSRILDANRDPHAPLSGVYDNAVIVDRGSYFDDEVGYTIPYADVSYTLTTADQGEHSYTERFYFVSLYNKQMQPYGNMWLRGDPIQ